AAAGDRHAGPGGGGQLVAGWYDALVLPTGRSGGHWACAAPWSRVVGAPATGGAGVVGQLVTRRSVAQLHHGSPRRRAAGGSIRWWRVACAVGWLGRGRADRRVIALVG